MDRVVAAAQDLEHVGEGVDCLGVKVGRVIEVSPRGDHVDVTLRIAISS